MKRPIIGITANFSSEERVAKLAQTYYKCVERSGGVPVLLAPTVDEEALEAQLEAVDGLLFTGGGDINPLLLGEEPSPKLGSINAERDRAELLLCRMAYNRCLPMFGICRGLQIIVAALGGRLLQDISDKQAIKHSQNAERYVATHTVRLTETDKILRVNSFHHQVAASAGDRLKVTAYSPEGFIEAVASSECKPVIAVQWHPENLYDSEPESSRPYFNALIQDATVYAQAKQIHRDCITIDSHCDTPMFFHLGVNLSERDERVLVDFRKMREGKLDAVNMVCYLPQRFSENIHFPIASPREYADFIFNEIEKQVAESDGLAAMARMVSDLQRNKREGKCSVMLGIENGLALEGDIRNVERFAKRGITYITLCHNGDNDICDSAKGNATHGGLSKFGKEVVKEMNRLGVLIDLSHCAESTFYDVLKESSAPVVCSHSNCRALCDHPRNLTDEQMKALADKGGVMQITLYDGFLRKEGGANIGDVLKHLEYAIKILGIDHVGIGTDFDGDGGIPGIASASDFINLTQHLLYEGYTKEQIEKILGGNWLRCLAK